MGHLLVTLVLCPFQFELISLTNTFGYFYCIYWSIWQNRSGAVVVCRPSKLHLKHICLNSRLGFNIILSKYFLVTLNCVVSGCIIGELF